MSIKLEPNEKCFVELERTDRGLMFGVFLNGFDFDEINLNAITSSEIKSIVISSIINMVDTIGLNVSSELAEELFTESINALEDVLKYRKRIN